MQNITLNATIQDGNITFNLNDFVKLIQSTQLTNTEYKPTPQAMAFDTKKELDEYVKNNPLATCKGIATNDLVKFIRENQDKYLFLKEANLCGADLRGADLRDADLRGANLCGADLDGADLRGADLRDANLRCADLRGADLRLAYLRGAKYDSNTQFPDGFTIPNIMIKL